MLKGPKTRKRILSFNYLIFLFIMLNLFSGAVSAQNSIEFEISFDGNLKMEYKLTMEFIGQDAKHIRNEIDFLADTGNNDGFIDQDELDKYEAEYGFEAFNNLALFSIDDTNPKAESWSLEISNAGVDRYSEEPIYKIMTGTATWPDIDVNANNHRFVKHASGELSKVKITFAKNWEITKFTGINNSKLSSNKLVVEGNEFPGNESVTGYLVVINIQKAKEKEKDEGGFLPGFNTTDSALIMGLLVIALYYRYRK